MTYVIRHVVMIIPLYINIKSLCHIPETNTMLYVNYTSFKKIQLYANSNKGKLIQAVCMKTVIHFLEIESSRNPEGTAAICTEYYSSKISVG